MRIGTRSHGKTRKEHDFEEFGLFQKPKSKITSFKNQWIDHLISFLPIDRQSNPN